MKVQCETLGQQLQEIGAYLKQVREANSIRIEEVAAKTRIRMFCLQALEEGKLEDLPEPVYVKGFIRRYGDALGLDGSALSQKFADTFPKEEPKVDPEQTYSREKISIPVLPILYVLIIGTASFGLFSILNPQGQTSLSNKNPNSPKPNQTKSVSQSSASKSNSEPNKSNPKSTPKPTPKPSPTKQANKSTVDIKLKTNQRSWVEVKVDGVQKFKNILEKDKQQSWVGKNIYVRSGNAGGVLISVDGSEFKPFGEVGQIEEKTYKLKSNETESSSNSESQ